MSTIYLELAARNAVGFMRAHADALYSQGYPLMAEGVRRQADKLAAELELREPIAPTYDPVAEEAYRTGIEL